jgi:hypothetical protein
MNNRGSFDFAQETSPCMGGVRGFPGLKSETGGTQAVVIKLIA